MNLFPVSVVILFIVAAISEMVQGNQAKAMFYWLSAAINVNVIFLR